MTNNNRFNIGIAQNDETPLVLGQTIWGGNVRKRVRKSPASDKICTGYEWKLSYNESLRFIEDIKPFMIIPYKINQINQAIEKCSKGIQRRFKCHLCELDYASPSGRTRHVKNFHKSQMLVSQ